MKSAIADTGFIVALLDRHDKFHPWANACFAKYDPPYRVCEAVLTEATHLVMREKYHPSHVLDFVDNGTFLLDFDLELEFAKVSRFMQTYADQYPDLADACVVRMSELYPRATVLAVDSDFYVYRREDGSAVPVDMPERV